MSTELPLVVLAGCFSLNYEQAARKHSFCWSGFITRVISFLPVELSALQGTLLALPTHIRQNWKYLLRKTL